MCVDVWVRISAQAHPGLRFFVPGSVLSGEGRPENRQPRLRGFLISTDLQIVQVCNVSDDLLAGNNRSSFIREQTYRVTAHGLRHSTQARVHACAHTLAAVTGSKPRLSWCPW